MTLSFRSAGRAGIISGVVGIVTVAALLGAVFVRNAQGLGAAKILFRMNQAGSIVQFLLMIPVMLSFCQLARQNSPVIRGIGMGALAFAVLLEALAAFRVVADPLYTFPEGVFGAWLMLISWRMPGMVSRGLRWFGFVVGLGLVLVGVFPLGYALFVDTIILQIPAASDAAVGKVQFNTANMILHYLLFAGTFLGVITFPFWAIWMGRRLLREGSD